MTRDPRVGTSTRLAFRIGRLVNRIFRFGAILSALALFMTYVLGLGLWTIPALNDARVIDVGQTILFATVLIGIANCLVFQPMMYGAIISIDNKTLYSDLAALGEDRVEDMKYFKKTEAIVSIGGIVENIFVGVILLLAHDPVMNMIGNPITDILAVLLALFAPEILGSVIEPYILNRARLQNPELFEEWTESHRF